MPLNAGDVNATQGLAREIFLVLDAELAPSLEGLDDEQLEQVRTAWRRLSFCVASGVVTHLVRVPPGKTEFAQTLTSSTHDATYWGWLSGFATVFRTWASSGGTLAQLHAALTTFFNANPTPTQLRGILQ